MMQLAMASFGWSVMLTSSPLRDGRALGAAPTAEHWRSSPTNIDQTRDEESNQKGTRPISAPLGFPRNSCDHIEPKAVISGDQWQSWITP
jgi:hypothetical protein